MDFHYLIEQKFFKSNKITYIPMICIIALVVFSILGIFSATHRKIAIEAFDCVFRKITLRKCQTGLDKRLKSQITSSIMRKNRNIGKFIYQNFEVISWLFTILMLVSLFFSGQGIYYYAKYGNCNGPQSDAFCIFDPAGQNKFSGILTNYTGEIILPDSDDDFFLGPNDAKVEVIIFGCFKCPYSKKALPTIDKMIETYINKVKFVYRDFPLTGPHLGAEYSSEAAECARDQQKYWQYTHKLFLESSESCTVPGIIPEFEIFVPELLNYAKEIGLNETQFNECLITRKYKEEVEADTNAGIMAGVDGTPTFFINGEKIVGPKSFNTFKKIINKKLKEAGE